MEPLVRVFNFFVILIFSTRVFSKESLSEFSNTLRRNFVTQGKGFHHTTQDLNYGKDAETRARASFKQTS
jgi:hypothetical protein